MRRIVLIGSSTGGVKTLRGMLTGLARLDAAILLVQHMPRFINRSLCKSLAGLMDMRVRIAEDEEPIEHGTLYIAPGGLHARLVANRTIRLADGPKVCYVKPSADVLMKSVVARRGDRVMGVVMTGMGRDGAEGLAHLRSIGALTVAQKPETCVVAGMPTAAIETGAVQEILDPAGVRRLLETRIDVVTPCPTS